MINVYVYRDTMSHNTKTKGHELDRAIKMLGLNKKEVDHIIRDNTIREENILFSGGPMYCSSYYGTISIKDF